MNWSPTGADTQGGFGLRQQIALAFLAFLALVSHRPDAVLTPQFFAEDGAVWYRDAYVHGGLNALFMAQAGYQHLIQRLFSAVAMLLPLRFAPLLFNLVSLSCMVLVVNLLASRRLAFLIPDLRVRLLMGFVYIGMPDSWETTGLFTTSHWHLMVASCIVILGEPARGRLWRLADCGVLAFAVLSGPLGIPLVIAAAVMWWLRRERWSAVYLSVIAFGAVVQGVTALLTLSVARSPAPLEASLRLFAEIVGTQVVLVSLVGEKFFFYTVSELIDSSTLVLAAFFCGAAVFAYTLWRSPWPMRLFVAFALMVLAAALTTPLVSLESTQWPQLVGAGIGGRYWLIPRLAFLVSLYWVSTAAKHRLARLPARMALILLLPIGIAIDWSHRPFADIGWSDRVEDFYRAEPGTTIDFPLQPPGWTVTLTKK